MEMFLFESEISGLLEFNALRAFQEGDFLKVGLSVSISFEDDKMIVKAKQGDEEYRLGTLASHEAERLFPYLKMGYEKMFHGRLSVVDRNAPMDKRLKVALYIVDVDDFRKNKN